MMESGRLWPAFFVPCPKLPPKPFTLPFTHTRTHYQHINHPRQPEPPLVHPSSAKYNNHSGRRANKSGHPVSEVAELSGFALDVKHSSLIS